MSRRDKLLAKMVNSPGSIRFGEVDALLRHEGFTLFKRRGSHCTYRREGGPPLVIVRPHGKRKTFYPDEIRRILGVLGL